MTTNPNPNPNPEAPMPLRQMYEQIILLAADGVELLRRCDVGRVLDEASEQGRLPGFAKWLGKARPDLVAEIAQILEV